MDDFSGFEFFPGQSSLWDVPMLSSDMFLNSPVLDPAQFSFGGSSGIMPQSFSDFGPTLNPANYGFGFDPSISFDPGLFLSGVGSGGGGGGTGLSGLGKGALLAGGGLLAAGLAQQFLRGSPEQRTQVQRQVASMSPEEQALFQHALHGTSRANEFAYGLPGQFGGLGAQTQGLQPLGMAATGQATQGLSQAAERTAGLSTPVEQRLAGLLQTNPNAQYDILSSLVPTAQGMAQGRLNISPELSQTVEQAFTPGIERALLGGLENLQERGFAGGFKDTTANLTPFLQRALSEIQGQMAREKLNLAQSLPVAAAQIAGAYNQPFSNQATAFGNLGLLNRSLQATLGDVGNTLAFQNPNEFLRTSTGLGSSAAGIGGTLQQGRLGSAGQTSLTQMPSPGILDTLGSLGPFLYGGGQLLSGLSGGQGLRGLGG